MGGSSAAASAAKSPGAVAAEAAYQRDVVPFLQKYCFECHGNGKAKADMTFDKYKDDLSVWNDRKTWDTVQHMLETHEMPPKKKPQPQPAEVDAVLKSIGALFERLDRTAKPNVGRVTIRRLNKTEYNNTIRDLIGGDIAPADDFPADDVGYGFDNIGDVLSVTPLLLERYLSAAEQILEQAIVVADPPKPSKSLLNNIQRSATAIKSELGGNIAFEAGEYNIRVRLSGDQIGDEPVKVMLRAAGKDVKQFDVTAPKDKPMVIEARTKMEAGSQRISVAFLNPYTLPDTRPSTNPATKPASQPAAPPPVGRRNFGAPPVSDGKTRILFLRDIEVEGPFNPPPPTLPEVHKRLMAHKEGGNPRQAAREIVSRFATKAFRRPVKDEEVESFLKLYDDMDVKGKRFEVRVRAALYRVLVSPHFLFRIELDPPGAKAGETYAINEYELASRLSYFLWNSMPDEELTTLAGKGQLRTNLDAQIKRMIKDTRSTSFLHGFAEQWLTLRKLELASPDPKMFPSFDASLRKAMAKESMLFFEAIVRENRPMLDLLDADFTYVNGQLARHYGMSNFRGRDWDRVTLPAGKGGILTQASVLTLTSNATRTSPVKRGKFVLEQILNTPPRPPPEDVPALEDQKQLKGTLRQIMEQHRANPVCASCHQRMDPIGFAFENYDPVGAWREKDAGVMIDPSGTLPDGKSFSGPAELKRILKEKKDLFTRCLSEKMLVYALGRGLEYYDRRAVDKIMTALEKDQYRFSTLLTEIIKSDPFQKRTATGEAR